MIHTTVGIYSNGYFKTNGVIDSHLKDHIAYNKLYRFGRALLVDGEICYTGYWNKEDLQKFVIEKGLDKLVVDENTAPYH